MNEIKSPKKPLIYYYGIALLILLLLNFFVVPFFMQQQVKEVDYGTFMSMTEKKDISLVEIEDNKIIFTDKAEENIYKTAKLADPTLTERLYAAGAKFSGEIVEQTSPILSAILTWVLPIILFIAIGQFMAKKMMDKAGGANSMMFGMGKSNAKVYVKSS